MGTNGTRRRRGAAALLAAALMATGACGADDSDDSADSTTDDPSAVSDTTVMDSSDAPANATSGTVGGGTGESGSGETDGRLSGDAAVASLVDNGVFVTAVDGELVVEAPDTIPEAGNFPITVKSMPSDEFFPKVGWVKTSGVWQRPDGRCRFNNGGGTGDTVMFVLSCGPPPG